ncbi:hypothetical protein ACG0Z3_03090 [Roseateles sp. LKC17W]|uniref:Amidohydrolase family protein n=1 Tax=Pelomonas margarita TaxID=3299031 RepID=A0ABW7FD66_9BURK
MKSPLALPCLAALTITWASLTVHAMPNTQQQHEPRLLRHATLHPLSGPAIPDGSLLIEGGCIRTSAASTPGAWPTRCASGRCGGHHGRPAAAPAHAPRRPAGRGLKPAGPVPR